MLLCMMHHLCAHTCGEPTTLHVSVVVVSQRVKSLVPELFRGSYCYETVCLVRAVPAAHGLATTSLRWLAAPAPTPLCCWAAVHAAAGK